MVEATKEMETRVAEAAPREAERTRSRRTYRPLVDIIERKDDIVLLADMPGVDERSVEVTLEKNVLTIYGAVEPVAPEGYRLHGSEYGVGDYRRVFSLSDEVQRDRIQATVKEGVLRLVLPKAEAVRTRKIEVRAEA
jgi:HSP20 family protein